MKAGDTTNEAETGLALVPGVRETAVGALNACSIDTPREVVAEINLAVDGFLGFAKAVGEQRKKFMEEYVTAHGRVKKKKVGEEDELDALALVVGNTLYTIDHEEKISCDPKKRTAAVFGIEDACDGDIDQIHSLYSAGWFKQGAIRKVLAKKFGSVEAGEKRFRELFTVTKEPKLSDDGEPTPKKLVAMNLNYLQR